MKDELTEIQKKVKKYIVRRIKESHDKTDFLIKDFSSDLGIDKNIVQETLKYFEAEKHIYIIHDWDKNKS